MKFTKLILATATVALFSSCEKEAKKETVEPSVEKVDKNQDEFLGETMEDADKELNLTFAAKSGSDLGGTADFMQKGSEVILKVSLTGIETGEHAIHIHENGDCSSDDAKSAGGHWNPSNEPHGKWDTEAYHMGDIGNLIADEDGNAELEFSTDKWCLGCEDVSKNILGKSLIVHAKADDFESQPSGAAGARVGCVVIED